MADGALDRLSLRLGLDPQAARRAADAAAASQPPWYLRVAAGIGAWATAAAAIVATGLILAQALDGEALAPAAAGVGAALAAAAATFLRQARGEFAIQLGVAAALAGQALAVGGLGLHAESTAVAAAVALASASLLVAAVRSAELQFLASALAVGTAFLALYDSALPQPLGWLATATLPVSLVLLLRPPAAVDLRGPALALLLVPMAAMSVPEAGGSGAGWLPRAVYALALVAVLGLVVRTTSIGRPAAMTAVALLAGAVAAPGIAASLLLLALAYLLGSRMLAILGALAQAWFLSRFYYDLDLTLLRKSGMLAAVGLLLLAAWWMSGRRRPAEAGRG